MKTSIYDVIHPYSYICFRRDSNDNFIFTVSTKGEVEVPGFLGQFSDGYDTKGKEFIFMVFDNKDDEYGMSWSIYTTNPDAVGARHTGEYFEERELLHITSFYLTSEYHAVAKYGKGALLIKFHDNYFRRVTISFIDGFGNNLEQLSRLVNCGLIDDKVA